MSCKMTIFISNFEYQVYKFYEKNKYKLEKFGHLKCSHDCSESEAQGFYKDHIYRKFNFDQLGLIPPKLNLSLTQLSLSLF